ncbi:MAG: rhamnulokinase [Promethearchaeota archaeon]
MKFIAIDLGASSGRVTLGILEERHLSLQEIHRFPNGGIQTLHGYHWDLLAIYSEIIMGLTEVAAKYGSKLDGIAVDSWGVDYVLFNHNKKPLLWPYHYRDERTVQTYEKVFAKISREEVFSITGIQFMEINSICQLYASMQENKHLEEALAHFLMIPDYFTYLLCGHIMNEYTNASTTQLLDAKGKNWCVPILDALDIPPEIFHTLTTPGTHVGVLLSDIAQKTHLSPETPIFATASHDTAAAVAAVPYDQDNYSPGEWVYISSGTWSLIGVEVSHPILSEMALKYNFTNEGGVADTIRLLKNLTGFWILEESLKIWREGNPEITWNDIILSAEKSPISSISSLSIDINHSDFVHPRDMIKIIQKHVKEQHGKDISEIGDLVQIIFLSMVKSYQQTIKQIEEITEIGVKVVHIIGGGAQNGYLNQMVANRLNLPVVAGPVEATTIGNIIMQAIGKKVVENLSTARKIVRDSFDVKVFMPADSK